MTTGLSGGSSIGSWLHVEWKVAGSSPAVHVDLYFPSPFFPFPFLSSPPFFFLSPFIFSLHARSATSMLKHFSSRGGASEASGATFTNHVAGNRAISYMVVYPSYTTWVNTRACANGAELAIFFCRERNSDLDIVNFLYC